VLLISSCKINSAPPGLFFLGVWLLGCSLCRLLGILYLLNQATCGGTAWLVLNKWKSCCRPFVYRTDNLFAGLMTITTDLTVCRFCHYVAVTFCFFFFGGVQSRAFEVTSTTTTSISCSASVVLLPGRLKTPELIQVIFNFTDRGDKQWIHS